MAATCSPNSRRAYRRRSLALLDAQRRALHRPPVRVPRRPVAGGTPPRRRQPALYIADLRQRQPRTTAAAQFLASELRGRYLSPQWIAAMQREATPAAWKCSTWPTTCGRLGGGIAPRSAPTSGERCATPSSWTAASWVSPRGSKRTIRTASGADHRAHGRGHPGATGTPASRPAANGRALAATGGRRRRRGRRGDHRESSNGWPAVSARPRRGQRARPRPVPAKRSAAASSKKSRPPPSGEPQPWPAGRRRAARAVRRRRRPAIRSQSSSDGKSLMNGRKPASTNSPACSCCRCCC